MKPRSARERLLHRRLQAFEHALPDASSGDAVSVHRTRVASRRVREAMPVVLVDLSPKKLKRLTRSFRRVTRALGPIRELDVTLRVLDEAAAAHRTATDIIGVVARDLEFERDRRRQELAACLEHVEANELVSRIEDAAAIGAARDSGARSETRAVLAVRVVRRVRRLEQAVAAAGPLYAPEPLHRVRIATKKLRYAIELAYDLRITRSRQSLRRLERMQETLGRMHDLQVLIGRLAAAQAALPPSASDAIAALSRVAHALDAECRGLHASYLAEREPLLASVADSADAISSAPAPHVETAHASSSVH